MSLCTTVTVERRQRRMNILRLTRLEGHHRFWQPYTGLISAASNVASSIQLLCADSAHYYSTMMCALTLLLLSLILCVSEAG